MLEKIESRRRGLQKLRWLKASSSQWTWVWASSGSWWWTGRPGMLQSMELQSQAWLSDWTELRNHWNSVWGFEFDVLKNPVLYLMFLLSHFKFTYSWTTWMCTENSRVGASRCFQTLSCRVLGIPSLDLRGEGDGTEGPGAPSRSQQEELCQVSFTLLWVCARFYL